MGKGKVEMANSIAFSLAFWVDSNRQKRHGRGMGFGIADESNRECVASAEHSANFTDVGIASKKELNPQIKFSLIRTILQWPQSAAKWINFWIHCGNEYLRMQLFDMSPFESLALIFTAP